MKVARIKVSKIMFSKKATKNDEILTVDLMLCSKRQMWKISSIFMAFLENMNFTLKNQMEKLQKCRSTNFR